MSPGLLRLAARLSHRYLASYESCLRLVAPPRAAAGRRATEGLVARWVVRAKPPETVKLTSKQQRLVAAIPEDGIVARAACAAAG